MSNLSPFRTAEFELSIQPHETDGFRVPAAQVARALSVDSARNLLRGIPANEQGVSLVTTPGGQQQAGYLTEAGFYRAIGMRQTGRIEDPQIRAQVERFQAWVYGEVLPALRRGASVSAMPDITTPAGVAQMAQMFADTANQLVASEAKVAELEPVANRLLNAEGDLAVADAAKALTRAGIKVGETRLFNALAERKWIFRGSDNRWRVYQSVIEDGYMSVIPASHYHPRTGVLVLDPPQVRVKPKGLQRLLIDHGVEVEAALEFSAPIGVRQ